MIVTSLLLSLGGWLLKLWAESRLLREVGWLVCGVLILLILWQWWRIVFDRK